MTVIFLQCMLLIFRATRIEAPEFYSVVLEHYTSFNIISWCSHLQVLSNRSLLMFIFKGYVNITFLNVDKFSVVREGYEMLMNIHFNFFFDCTVLLRYLRVECLYIESASKDQKASPSRASWGLFIIRRLYKCYELIAIMILLHFNCTV